MAEETKQGVLTETTSDASSTTTALVEVDTSDLNKESLKILNELIAETDLEKTKDLTYLFNINQNKKTMVRIDKLSELQDSLVAQFAKRVAERPDEISNQELMNSLKIVQDIIERGTKQIVGTGEQPFIQINQQTNSVNVGDDKVENMSKDSRDRVKNAVYSILKDLATSAPVESEAIEVKSTEDKND